MNPQHLADLVQDGLVPKAGHVDPRRRPGSVDQIPQPLRLLDGTLAHSVGTVRHHPDRRLRRACLGGQWPGRRSPRVHKTVGRHSAGEIEDAEALLAEQAAGVVRRLAHVADEQNRAVGG